ncbi:MAG TPA: DUF6798 domain-containing protein, partial [Pirellulaceae bacterium]
RAWGILAWAALSVPVIVPVLLGQGATDSATVQRANQIHVYERLPHHLVPHSMSMTNRIRFAVLVGAWLLMRVFSRPPLAMHRFQNVVGATLLIAGMGTLVDLATLSTPAAGAAILKYYWFRLSDVLIPAGLGLGLLHLVLQHRPNYPRWSETALVGILLLTAGCLARDFLAHRGDRRPRADQQGDFGLGSTHRDGWQAFLDWRDACAWAREATDASQLFLTPTRSQTFKWYAERPEFATWKDCPQDPRGILAWRERIEAVRKLGLYQPDSPVTAEGLRAFAVQHGVNYVVVVRPWLPELRGLAPAFRNDTFDIYRMP